MEYRLLQSFTNYIDAHIIAGRLEESGVKCWLKDENTVAVNPLWTQAVGGIKIMVAEDDFDSAKKLLEEYEAERRANMKCPKCESSRIEYVSSPRSASNWLGSIVFFILGSLALPLKKTWHCFSCGAEFDEPKIKETVST